MSRHVHVWYGHSTQATHSKKNQPTGLSSEVRKYASSVAVSALVVEQSFQICCGDQVLLDATNCSNFQLLPKLRTHRKIKRLKIMRCCFCKGAFVLDKKLPRHFTRKAVSAKLGALPTWIPFSGSWPRWINQEQVLSQWVKLFVIGI